MDTPTAPGLDPRKFQDPFVTAKGERRAHVKLEALNTLWFNTGTLCNLTCENCYIESSPRNDRLVYLSAPEVSEYLDEIGVALDANDPVTLMIFPEMDATVDVPEITEACWGILDKSPGSVMCATARMVAKHKGAAHPTVVACTLLPYDPQFDLGRTLV